MRKIDPLENDIRVLKDSLNARFDYLNDRIRQLEHPAKYQEGDRVFYMRDRPREVDFVWFDDGCFTCGTALESWRLILFGSTTAGCTTCV